MSTEMRVQPAVLVEAARGMSAAADQMGRMLQRLSSTVTSGNPWGSDEPGTMFGTAYSALLSDALSVYEAHVEQLDLAHDALVGWASSMIQTDDASANAVSSSGATVAGSVTAALTGAAPGRAPSAG